MIEKQSNLTLSDLTEGKLAVLGINERAGLEGGK